MDDSFFFNECPECGMHRCVCFETKLASLHFNYILNSMLKNLNPEYLKKPLRRVKYLSEAYPLEKFNKERFLRGFSFVTTEISFVCFAMQNAEFQILNSEKHHTYFKTLNIFFVENSIWKKLNLS